ncbi:endothelin-converting enzyme 2 isoform X3 [Fopius arisanus]|uniref:Endothelin-converting enzyme 2 isoform X3 n=1 Tax=Fopius arisanus TaxID=64838 RepID=A0A9R1T5L5_9HYME|nr:PREDICTED: endothelin-converting enzyme 2-like isoform X3 [Fopius arisanus]
MKLISIVFFLAVKWIGVCCYTSAKNNRDSSAVCKARECKTLASGMNKSVNPCDDFWEYTCGNWISRTPIPAGEATWNRFVLLFKQVKDKTREILESAGKPTDFEMMGKARRWYRSCMDTGQREAVGIKQLRDIMENIGGWPITMTDRQWAETKVSWQNIDLYYGGLTGRHTFYSIESGKNYVDLLRYKIMVTKASLPLAHKLPIEKKKFDEKDRGAYTKLIKNVAQSFIDATRSPISANRISHDVNEIINFEVKLSKIPLGRLFQYPSIEYVTSHYNYYFGASETAKVNVTDYIQQIYNFGNLTIASSEIINVYYDYVNDLGTLLKDTPMRTIVNYVHWHFVSDFIDATDRRMNNYLLEFKRETYGIRENRPLFVSRWEECVGAMHLHHAVAPEFIKKYFTNRVKDAAVKMITSLKTTMEHEILEANWIDDYTKRVIIRKLKDIIALIGYPEWYSDGEFMATAYWDLSITSNYLDNIFSWWRFIAGNKARQLRSKDTRTLWYGDPVTVNAFYRIFLNNINLPAATFQLPFFSPDLPDVVNYAILGSIAGHEISHAFDPLGIQYDENGRFRRLSSNFMGNYIENAMCFDDQYQKYGKNDRIGVTTLHENIADNQGARVSFEAYKSLPQRQPTEQKLPGLEDYSTEQSFFILFSSIWCSKATPEFISKKAMDEEDHHSVHRLRVIGTLSNMEDFAKAFNCPKGSPMNPQSKCNLWTRKARANHDLARRMWGNSG